MKRVVVSLAWLLAIALPAPGLSQQIPFPLPEGLDRELPERPVETQILTSPEARPPGAEFLADRMIDRSQYVLGASDRVSIAIMGYTDAFYQVEVSPEGLVLLPKVGGIPVGGLNLVEAERRVAARARSVYPAADVDLALSVPRTFKVYLAGDVPDPGPRVASPLTRVSELMPERDPATEARQIRNVFVVRAPGDTLSIDLARFRHTGDLRFNPTVLEGDVVLVPGLDETVRVYGRVFFPGEYEYRPGETLADLLRVANGYRSFPSNAHDVIEVTRFVGKDERRFFEFRRAEAMGETGESFVLEPFDAVYVPAVANYKVQRTATVEGEVLLPGTYPIRPDTTTVRDLVEMAGGFTAEASLVSARLVRSRIGAREEALEALQMTPPEFLTEDERRILRVRQTSDPSNVVIDFFELFAEGQSPYAVTLQDGDSLAVPREREGVTVLGAVLEPGIVLFEPGLSIDEYVGRAGGYTEKADEGDVVVLKAKLETRLERDEVAAIEVGDTIVVPFEEERDWWRTWQVASSITTGVLSLVLSFIAATR
ncbi:MAG: SLBB domain-containing protein [Gemmatimonadetes bacterium]|nr:SLBB domain-containing protein [Gemmatimonadota bacterium]